MSPKIQVKEDVFNEFDLLTDTTNITIMIARQKLHDQKDCNPRSLKREKDMIQ